MFRVLAAIALFATSLTPALAAPADKDKEKWTGGPRPEIEAVAPPTINFSSKYRNGTIIIDTKRRRLLYVRSDESAYLYPITVGRDGFQWNGTTRVSAKKDWPDWRPPEEMRERQPNLPVVMTGGINNPLGAKALYLGSSLYRIHGTNNAKSIGLAASSGCFRMHNSHVAHLSQIAKVGTKVVVLKSLPRKLARSFDRKTQSKRNVASRRPIPVQRNAPSRKVDMAWRRAILGTN